MKLKFQVWCPLPRALNLKHSFSYTLIYFHYSYIIFIHFHNNVCKIKMYKNYENECKFGALSTKLKTSFHFINFHLFSFIFIYIHFHSFAAQVSFMCGKEFISTDTRTCLLNLDNCWQGGVNGKRVSPRFPSNHRGLNISCR